MNRCLKWAVPLVAAAVLAAGASRAAPTFQPVMADANVGSRVLSDLKVTFDQKSKRVKLERPAVPSPPARTN